MYYGLLLVLPTKCAQTDRAEAQQFCISLSTQTQFTSSTHNDIHVCIILHIQLSFYVLHMCNCICLILCHMKLLVQTTSRSVSLQAIYGRHNDLADNIQNVHVSPR